MEQLLSRTIAERRARDSRSRDALRVAATIQLGLAVLFVVVALLLRDPIEDELFSGDSTLYWCLIAAVTFYAASYFARGFLAGEQRFALYGGLVLMESASRVVFVRAAGDRRGRQRERRRDRDRGRAAAEPVRGAVGAGPARAAR